MLSIGDRVEMTAGGAAAHWKHHDDHAKVASVVPVPKAEVLAEVLKEAIFTFPEAGWSGEIVERQERWLGQPGYDYLVKWDHHAGQSWHLIEHLKQIN